MKRRIRVLAGFWAVVLTLGLAASALGYTGQVAASLSIGIEAAGTCGATPTVTATLIDADGAPVAGESVAWELTVTQSTADKVNTTPTVTNAAGVATTTVTLAAVSGNRTIRATSGEVSASAIVSQACGGLPNTSTVPSETSGTPAALAIALIAGMVLALGGALALRRAATSR